MTTKRIPTAIATVRPDLRWAEDILGESLQPAAPVPPAHGTANDHLDTSVIPDGDYCYYQRPIVDGYVPCPYFENTRYGSVKCNYVAYEAYEHISTDRPRVARHFGGIKKMEAAGVVADWWFADSNKICGVNLPWGSYVDPHLEAALKDYADSVAGHRSRNWISVPANWKDLDEGHLGVASAADDRLTLWQLLCSMVEEVPRSFIERLVKVDNDLRTFSEPSDDPVAACWPDDLPNHANPKKQFWYFYRKNLRPSSQIQAAPIASHCRGV
jgi:hypothetical protein